jgi:hypothetical protein
MVLHLRATVPHSRLAEALSLCVPLADYCGIVRQGKSRAIKGYPMCPDCEVTLKAAEALRDAMARMIENSEPDNKHNMRLDEALRQARFVLAVVKGFIGEANSGQ